MAKNTEISRLEAVSLVAVFRSLHATCSVRSLHIIGTIPVCGWEPKHSVHCVANYRLANSRWFCDCLHSSVGLLCGYICSAKQQGVHIIMMLSRTTKTHVVSTVCVCVCGCFLRLRMAIISLKAVVGVCIKHVNWHHRNTKLKVVSTV